MLIGRIDTIGVRYQGIDQHDEWVNNLPKSNWLLLIIANEVQPTLFSKLVTRCMAHEPSYVCCVGDGASVLEEWFDEEIVEIALAWEKKQRKQYDYDVAPVTTADTSLDEGFWFATSVAPASVATLETVFCLDVTNECQNRIQELIPLINAGWFPPDE